TEICAAPCTTAAALTEWLGTSAGASGWHISTLTDDSEISGALILLKRPPTLALRLTENLASAVGTVRINSPPNPPNAPTMRLTSYPPLAPRKASDRPRIISIPPVGLRPETLRPAPRSGAPCQSR